jgi:general secretion pathway protein M
MSGTHVMIDLVSKWMPRSSLFFAFNAAAGLFLILFVFTPAWSHFASRSEEIEENAAQLWHFQSIGRDAKVLMEQTAQAGEPFLPGSEERLVSADLQANLKAMTTTAGVRLLGIRGLQGSRSQQLRMVVVSVELEGPLQAIRDVVLAIESQRPFLFVTAASLRSLADGDDGLIRAELKVQGAMRDRGLPGASEAITQ